MAEATTVNVTVVDDDNVTVNLNVQDETHAVNINVTELEPYIINIMFGEGIPNLQQVTEVGNVTTRVIQHAPATQPQHSATLGQVTSEVDSLYQWIVAQQYLTAANLNGYATQQWVLDQNYITSAALAGYATEIWVNEQGFLKAVDLIGYATEQWVLDQNYITADALNGYATEDWVNSQGFLKAADLNGYATETWVNNQEFLQQDDLEGYATEQWVEDQNYATEPWVLDQLKERGKLISFSVLVTTPTTGLVNAKWIDYNAITRQVVNSPVSFIGLPAEGNFRYDLIQGLNDGTVFVKTGTEGLIDAIVRPSAEVDKVSLGYILWSHTGEVIIVEPEPSDVFPSIRYQTQVAPNTTGKYAKICDFTLTPSNNYQVVVHFGNPISVVDDKGSTGNLLLSFTCNDTGEIYAGAVRIETVGKYVDAGEFVLIARSASLAELYHKSNHYWSRLQYSFPFFNVSVSVSNFYNNQPYGLLPSYDNIFESESSSIESNLLPDGVIFGGKVIWKGVGYEYRVTEAIVRYLQILYNIPEDNTIVLSAPHATFNRIDVIYAYIYIDEFGVITKGFAVLEGIPSADPVKPQIAETGEFELTFINVFAGTTEPPIDQTIWIYREYEWIGSFSGGGSVMFTSLNFPDVGTRSIETTGVQNNTTVRMNNGSPIDISNADSVNLRLSLKAVLNNGYNFAIRFRDAALNTVGLLVDITMIKNQINSYQNIVVPISAFNLNADIQYIDFVVRRSSGPSTHAGFFIDEWKIDGGVPVIPTGPIILTDEVSATGTIGLPIPVTVTDRIISKRTSHTTLAGTEEVLARLITGGLVKIPVSSLFSAGADGEDGREVEIRNSGTHIQWRYVGDIGWIDIVALIDLQGDDGNDGTPVELRQNGTFIQWKYITNISWIDLFDLSTLAINGLPNGGTTSQVLKKQSNADGDADWEDEAGGGGLELITFSSVINFAGNYKSYHYQIAAIAYTGPTVDALINFANTTEHYIRASGSHGIPTFNSQFVLMLNNWNNGVDKWNFIKFKMLPSGKIGYWIYDISA